MLSHRRSHLVVGTRAAGTTGYPGMSRHTGTGPENEYTKFFMMHVFCSRVHMYARYNLLRSFQQYFCHTGLIEEWKK